jgi:hypothetical protein
MSKEFDSIFLTSVATAGKDTLLLILKDILAEHVEVERISFADNLKISVNEFTRKMFDISAFTRNAKDKEMIRGIFVETGLIKRIQSRGTYWWKLIQPLVQKSIDEGCLPIVSDLRYCKYAEDEHFFAKNVCKGIIVHITRFDEFGNKVIPPNAQEMENDPKLEEMADYKLQWPTSDNKEVLRNLVETQLKELIDLICQKFPKKLQN